MKNKTIYLVVSYKCSACKLQKTLLQEALMERDDITLTECYLEDLPEWVRTKIPVGKYPITVLTEDEKVILSLIGTTKEKRIKEVINTIRY